jgi:hypothetical protein
VGQRAYDRPPGSTVASSISMIGMSSTMG